MKHQTEAQFSQNKDELEDDEDLISKSQLKRDSKDLQLLGKKLAALNPEQLERVPLDEKLLDAIALAHKIANKRGALKRHFQYIGKILRSIDVEPIISAVEDIEDSDNSAKLNFKKVEYWRDRILSEGEAAVNAYCDQQAQADRQKLRQLARNLKQANTEDKKTRFARQIFKEVQASLMQES
jgi:ribosome-associated protein